MTTKQNLIAAKALIDTPEKWTQGAYCRDAEGVSKLLGDTSICKYCTVGAIRTVLGKMDPYESLVGTTEWQALRVGALSLSYQHPISVNDTTNHPTVMKMFDLAIKECDK